MADYLTLLARRTLGMIMPVEPARVHHFAETQPPNDGTMEDGTPGSFRETRSTTTESDRGLRSGRGSSQVDSSPARSSSTTADDGEMAMVIGSKPTDPRGLSRQDDRAGAARAEHERLGRERIAGRGRATASAAVDEVDEPELLVPIRPGPRAMESPPGSSSEVEMQATGVVVEGSDGDRPPPSSADLHERVRSLPGRPSSDDLVDTSSGDAAIEVSIGTIEIRAVTPSPPAAVPRPPRVSSKLSLDDYLAQRRRGER